MKTLFLPTKTPASNAVLLAGFPSSEVIIDAYAGYLANVSESTKKTYSRALRNFFAYLQKYGIVSPVRGDIVSYKRELLARVEAGTLSALTVCGYLNAVRGFFGFLEDEGFYTNVARGIKSPKHTTAHKKQHLNAASVRDLLDVYKREDGATALRDYALTNLLVRTGLRTAEAVGANVGDISFIGSERVLYIKGKGHAEKDSFVYLTEKAFAPLREYLQTRQALRDSDPLFLSVSNHHASENGKSSARLSTRSVRAIVRRGLDAIGLDDKAFTAHSLRHTTAVGILEAGGSLEDVRAQLRHASVSTSRIYVESYNRAKQLERVNAALDNLF